MVGERPINREGYDVNRTGVNGSENAGMSNEIRLRMPDAEYPRFPTQRSSMWGESGPKVSPPTGGVADGQQIDISVQRNRRYFCASENKGLRTQVCRFLLPGD